MSLDSLAELWPQNKPLSEIGVQLGVSRSVVAGRINRARRDGDDRFPRCPVPALGRRRGPPSLRGAPWRPFRRPGQPPQPPRAIWRRRPS